ncbi:MAG: hypothetical protein DMD80_11890 [Candidatus Rokuibacteriota bacterium]|nr:MAG: hypothetical protein DMD80_11890 [Candidatus Rokubacteria bacterium]
MVLRALRRAAARGHHARRRYREGSEDRDRALRRERGAANLPPVRPRPAGQATRPSDAALGGRDAERTLGEGIDRARRRRRGHHGRHAAPRAPAHRLRGDVQGAGGVRAGLIGEIGNTWPWTENEKKVVRAAVEAQRQTGAPLMIHPGRDQTAPMQIVELIRKQGGDLRRTVMCHIERTIADERHLFDLAATGIWLEYDLFGLENSYYPYNPDFDMPNDGGRMTQILTLIARGHQDQVLMSHDIAYKSSLTKYGGYGYHHLLVNVVPRLRRKGVDDAGMRRLLVENPARAFVFV